MIFDASTLHKNDSLSKLARPPKICELPKLKEWWMRLSEQEQAQILTIDSPDIITDFTETVNTAFLLFKLHSESPNKTFISVKRQKDQANVVTSFYYEFKFLENEYLNKEIAQLFSCYDLFVSASLCKNEPRPDPTAAKDGTKSCITVKKEHLASILNLFSSTVINFAQGKKVFFNKEHDATLFSFFTKHAFLKLPFSEIQSSSIQELYYKLLSITLLFENNLYLSFSQKANTQIASRLVNTSKEFHIQAPTPAKIELQALLNSRPVKSNSPALSGTSGTSSTTSSDSNPNPKPRSVRNVKPFCPGKESFGSIILKLGKQASQDTVSEAVTNTSSATVDQAVKLNVETLKEKDAKDAKDTKEQDQDTSIQALPKLEGRQMSEGFYYGYDGFSIDNLEISFHAEDDCLMDISDDDCDVLTENSYVSNRSFGNGKGYKDYYYQRQSREIGQDPSLEQFSNKDRWQYKGKTFRYGNPQRNKENINWQEYDLSIKKQNNGEDVKHIEEILEEWDENYGNSRKGYIKGKEALYGENKGRWRGKGRNEIVYCPKGENDYFRGKKSGEEKENKIRIDRVKPEVYVS